jgi:serine/threonine protein kinase
VNDEPRGKGDDALRDLVERCLERMEKEGASALEALCREHPQHAAALRRRIEQLHSMGFVEIHAAKDAVPERLGEFRLIAPLGGGGMGVVYLAQQEGLGRKVALKLIRPENMYFPGARDRFRREVDAVAKLQHPGIVPIYTVGEENGVPYFAMELVEGKTIAQCVEALRGRDPAELTADDLRVVLGAKVAASTTTRGSSASHSTVLRGRWVEVCLRLVREVALALAHAHERGVLHRDVKPSNVMITPEGRVLLLDFGLAISQDASRLTRSGSMLGSRPYMAPEQVLGKHREISVVTDVYGLGVLLYELLTLNLPYSPEPPEELDRKIIEGNAEAPSKHNSAVPWDAATVCLTAMDQDPKRRYATADAFARDVTNVLELRPIEARAPSALLRTRRFVQRHPAASVALGLSLLVAVGGPAAYAFAERARRIEVAGFNAELSALNAQLAAALEAANESRARAEGSFRSALRAVDLMLSEVGSKELSDVPLMEGVRRRLLEQALAFYRSFLEERGDDPEVERRVAEGHDRIARILQQLGRHEEAVTHFASAIEGFERLCGDDEAAAGGNDELAATRSRLELGRLALLRGDLDGADRQVMAARERMAPRVAAAPDDIAAQLELARAIHLSVSVLIARGENLRAERLLTDALEADASLAAAGPQGAYLATTWWNDLGLMLMNDPASFPARADEIESAFLAALATSDRALVADPQRVDARIARSVSLNNLAGLYRRTERYEDAKARYQEAFAVLEALTAAYPERVESRKELAHVLNNLGVVAEFLARYDEAEKYYGDAVERLEELRLAMPASADLAANTGIGWLNLASCAKQRDDKPTEVSRLERSIAILDEARRLNPENPRYRASHYDALNGLGAARLLEGRHRDAVACFERAADAMAESVKHQTRNSLHVARCAAAARDDAALDAAARASAVAADAALATRILRRALEHGFEGGAEIGSRPEFEVFRGHADFDALLADLRGD